MSSVPNGKNPNSADDYGITGQSTHSLSHLLDKANQEFEPNYVPPQPQQQDIILLIAHDICKLPLPMIIELGEQMEKHKDKIKTDHAGLNNALILYHWAKEIIDNQTGITK